MYKEIGKIQRIDYGIGGYDDAMLGLSVTLGGESWGVGDFNGTWAHRSEGAQWTVQDQLNHFAETAVLIRELLKDAKVKSVYQLKNVPVEVTFGDDRRLKSWRILTEVL